jgi:hypothetical protein
MPEKVESFGQTALAAGLQHGLAGVQWEEAMTNLNNITLNLNPDGAERLARVREGFMMVDMALRDTLLEYARGVADEEQVLFALQRHRETYEDYLKGLYEFLVPIAEA